MPENKLYMRDENGNYHELVQQKGYKAGQTVFYTYEWRYPSPITSFIAYEDHSDGHFLVKKDEN